MALALMGTKIGMTRIFDEDGSSAAVTVIQFGKNVICDLKTKERDGYQAVKVACGSGHPNRVTKAHLGQCKKAGIELASYMVEHRMDGEDMAKFNIADELDLSMFTEGQFVDVVGTSKGKGFAGSIKRHNFGMQDATHGNSVSHRHLGSVGQCQDPGRVLKGKKMAGHMGNERCTVQNQKVVKVDAELKVILVRGAVPGAPGSKVMIKPSEKRKGDIK
jgi:large subunit ribosomal protein L3